MSDSRWYFTEEQLANSPSRKCGINAEQELSYRQRAANLIQEMGQRLQVSQLCINTAIVYMHRFYAFHSFTLFHRNIIAAAAFFLAAKVEEQPRKLEHVIKILNICLEKSENTRESYAEQAQDLVFNENVLLQTLGFDVAIDHPHTHVVRACQLFNIVTVSRELRQTCYFMASNSLHLTTMCLKYRPTVVAAFCIYIACKWSRWEIPDSSEGKAWYSYVDDNVTTDTLKKLTDEYLQILERSPSKFKSKMKAITSNGQTALNTNPSVHGRDEPPTPPTHHKTPHDKQHHHHHHHNKNNAGSSSSSRKQPVEASMSAPATSSKQPQQATTQASSSSYKNQSLTQSGVPASGSQAPRQRQSSSSSSQQQQQPYPGNDGATSQKSVNEDRTQHRQAQQEAASFNSSIIPRPIDSQKQRMSSGQASANMSSSSSSQQQPNQQPPQPKPTNHEQRHSLSSKPQVDYHQKSAKHPQSATSAEFQNRNSTSSSHSQPQQPAQPPQMSQKKPSWPQQQSSHQSNLQKPAQSHVQSSHSQPNLNSSSSSNNSRNSSQSLPSYNESTKQSSTSQPTAQNDYWFNEKLLETVTKAISPLRQTKSMFSPSPEHDAFDRTKLMMMTANVKRNDSPKSEKQDRRSSTPNKREKRAEQSVTPTGKSSSQVDRKLLIPKLENSSVPPTSEPGSQIKKRPFSTVDDGLGGEFNRDSKSRKLDTIKLEPPASTGAMKQPIETNPDIVKSLLQECYTVGKFESFGMDSPLDVINPDPPSSSKMELQELLLPKIEPRDNGFDEDNHKRNKSKKSKKEKHKHKKRKSHKSDREEREERNETPLKVILSESMQQAGGLKIKIPIKDVNKDLTGPPLLHPAPLKLKISKGNFNNSTQALSDGGSSSSSSHKKKDKDRSKSKSSKHGINNNNSEFKDVGYQQHQQLSVNKMSSQAPMQSSQSAQVQNAYDMSLLYGNNSFSQSGFFQQQLAPMMNPQQQQQQQQQQQFLFQQQQQQQQKNQQQFNNYDLYQNPNMNYSNVNNSNSGNKK